MHSALPKVLQPLAGRPLLAHVVGTARAIRPAAIHVVYGHGGEAVREAFAADADLKWALQAEQLGTGHAVMQAMPNIADDELVLGWLRSAGAGVPVDGAGQQHVAAERPA